MICTECRHALLQDEGYSNYTVEGTTFSCKLELNPHGSFDRFYGVDKRLAFAEQCTSFAEGDVEHHDVECPYECECNGTPFERKRLESKIVCE